MRNKEKPCLKHHITQTLKEKKDLSMFLNQVQLILASGKEVSEMDSVNKLGRTELVTKVIGRIIEHVVRENSLILMVIYMKETGSMIKQTD